MTKKVYMAQVENDISEEKYDNLMDKMNEILAENGDELDYYLTDDYISLEGCTDKVAQIVAQLDAITSVKIDEDSTTDYIAEQEEENDETPPSPVKSIEIDTTNQKPLNQNVTDAFIKVTDDPETNMDKKVYMAEIDFSLSEEKIDAILEQMDYILSNNQDELDDFQVDDFILLEGCTEKVTKIVAQIDGILSVKIDEDSTADYIAEQEEKNNATPVAPTKARKPHNI